MDDLLQDENLDADLENSEALLDDSIFEEVDIDDELTPDLALTDDDTDDTVADDEEEEEEIFDELDALAAEEDDEEFDFYGDEEEY